MNKDKSFRVSTYFFVIFAVISILLWPLYAFGIVPQSYLFPLYYALLASVVYIILPVLLLLLVMQKSVHIDSQNSSRVYIYAISIFAVYTMLVGNIVRTWMPNVLGSSAFTAISDIIAGILAYICFASAVGAGEENDSIPYNGFVTATYTFLASTLYFSSYTPALIMPYMPVGMLIFKGTALVLAALSLVTAIYVVYEMYILKMRVYITVFAAMAAYNLYNILYFGIFR